MRYWTTPSSVPSRQGLSYSKGGLGNYRSEAYEEPYLLAPFLSRSLWLWGQQLQLLHTCIRVVEIARHLSTVVFLLLRDPEVSYRTLDRKSASGIERLSAFRYNVALSVKQVVPSRHRRRRCLWTQHRIAPRRTRLYKRQAS